jgi:Fe-S cluster assembly protein SufD
MSRVFIVGSSELPQAVSVGRDETLDWVFVVLPGVSAEVPLTVDIDGAGADVRLSGLFLCGGDERVTFDIEVRHNVGDTHSRQFFNGIAGGTSRAAFHGRILVKEGAQRIKAFQENHNILLSDQARVETTPQLEIYADDVECSHGATTGFLSAEEQFYMRSRGIPEAEAKVLQMISFLAPVLSRIDDAAERERLSAEVEAALRSL